MSVFISIAGILIFWMIIMLLKYFRMSKVWDLVYKICPFFLVRSQSCVGSRYECLCLLIHWGAIVSGAVLSAIFSQDFPYWCFNKFSNSYMALNCRCDLTRPYAGIYYYYSVHSLTDRPIGNRCSGWRWKPWPPPPATTTRGRQQPPPRQQQPWIENQWCREREGRERTSEQHSSRR